ncbi:MAG: copper-translocating P-type ATPase [Chitinophagaceae bacterium]|nr:MAG: copper-translocating P-type ATPase [Chitinophagaceae bacterium]
MTCAACAVSVESTLQSLEGVNKAGVNYANQEAMVEFDATVVNERDFQRALQAIGYDIIPSSDDQQQQVEAVQLQHYKALKNRTLWAVSLAIPLVILGMFFMDLPYANWMMMVLSAPIVFYFGRNFFTNAFKQARHGKANMDTLVALSTGIAFLFSTFNTIYPSFWHQQGLHAHVYFEAAGVIIAFISLGKLLEERAKSNTTTALKKLMGMQPESVTRVLDDGSHIEIPVKDVQINHVLLVKPGERIAVDGKILSGLSYVDESMITGEPIPAEKKSGEKVFAGTINQKGSFSFVASEVGADTVLARIISVVREAQGSKAPVQRLVDKIAGIFVPVVIGISVLTFVVWMVVGGDSAFTHALLTSITVLVIACPCALGLATPTAIMVGVGKGAENNILVRNAESLETAHKIDAIILDKTGTITQGHPEVTGMHFENNQRANELSAILLSMEMHSEHPLAEAITRKLQADGQHPVAIDNFRSITGKGVAATFQNTEYFAGNPALMIENNVHISDEFAQRIVKWQQEAKTVIVFAGDKKALALIAIGDPIKKTSAEAVAALQARGIEVYMLTGDNHHTAAAVAKQMNIKHFEADVLPERKAAFVSELQHKGKTVAMVGDGINDSQALAVANLSIAMGKGSDIAMDIAGLTLISSDLKSVPKALSLSEKTIKTIKQNLFWAFIYNVIGIPIAAGVLYPINGFLLDPMLAGGAMALSSVSVVANSLRLKWAEL